MQLIWHGPVTGQSGYEVITRGILMELDKMGVQIKLDQSRNWNAENISLKWDVSRRLQRMLKTPVASDAPVIMHQKKQPIFDSVPEKAKKYCYTLFETDRLPVPWKEELNQMDGIFTFSDFNRDSWGESDLEKSKIHKLPFGVEEEFKPEGNKCKILNKRGFVFLTNGDFIERKNFELLLEAYVTEFKPSENVTLILKTHYAGFTIQHKNNLMHRIREIVKKYTDNPPKILFFGDKIPTEDMATLYRGCDCFVLPSRGEGLGLPVIEAMACGLPIIATLGNALLELNFQGWGIGATTETIDNIGYIEKCPIALNHKWNKVNITSLKKGIRHMFEEKEFCKRIGETNAANMEGRTWYDAAKKIIQVIFKKEEI